MYSVTGLSKVTLRFEEFVAANWSEVRRFFADHECEFYNLTTRRVRFA